MIHILRIGTGVLLATSVLMADIEIPVKQTDHPTCLGQVFDNLITPGGWGTPSDPNSATNFARSGPGILGITVFFETRPPGFPTDVYSGQNQAMLGVAYTMTDRYKVGWGAERPLV